MQKGLDRRSLGEVGFAPILTILLIIAATIGGYLIYSGRISLNQPKETACTLEAKICPDGTAVGRSGPNCEFAACPQVSDETANWKTYVNKDLKYSINHPIDFLIDVEKGLTVLYKGEKRKLNPGSIVDPYPPLTIAIYDRSSPKYSSAREVCDWELCQNLSYSGWRLEEVKINNATGVKLYSIDRPLAVDYYLASEDGNEIVRVIIATDGLDTLNSSKSNLSRNEDLELLLKILSTFKFTN